MDGEKEGRRLRDLRGPELVCGAGAGRTCTRLLVKPPVDLGKPLIIFQFGSPELALAGP